MPGRRGAEHGRPGRSARGSDHRRGATVRTAGLAGRADGGAPRQRRRPGPARAGACAGQRRRRSAVAPAGLPKAPDRGPDAMGRRRDGRQRRPGAAPHPRDTFTERLRHSLHPPGPRAGRLLLRDGRAVLDAVRAGDGARWTSSRPRSPTRRRSSAACCPPGPCSDLVTEGHRRRHRRHGRVPAADLPAVLPDQPARGHGLPGAGGVRDGPGAAPLRPAGPRVRAAADVARLRAAGHHVARG